MPVQLRSTTLTLIYSTLSLPSWSAGSRQVACSIGATLGNGGWATLLNSAKGPLKINGQPPVPPPDIPQERLNLPPIPLGPTPGGGASSTGSNGSSSASGPSSSSSSSGSSSSSSGSSSSRQGNEHLPGQQPAPASQSATPPAHAPPPEAPAAPPEAPNPFLPAPPAAPEPAPPAPGT
jgi:hypothetical protein